MRVLGFFPATLILIDDAVSFSRCEGEDGVRIEFHDFGHLFDQPRESQEQFLDGIDVCGRMAAIPACSRR